MNDSHRYFVSAPLGAPAQEHRLTSVRRFSAAYLPYRIGPNSFIGWASALVSVRQVVLPQQVFPIVVPIWCANDTMNMLLRWDIRVFGES